MLRAILAQEVAVKGVVVIIEKRLLSIIAALRDMMGDIGNDNARETGHCWSVAERLFEGD